MYACKYVIEANLPLPCSANISKIECSACSRKEATPLPSTCEARAPLKLAFKQIDRECSNPEDQEPEEPQEPDLSPDFSFVCTRTLDKIDRECTGEDRDLLAVRVDPETRELVLLLAKRRRGPSHSLPDSPIEYTD